MDLLALTWNNHKKTFFSSISACRSNGQYTDVTLVCDGEYYPVHKLVLSSSSDYFKDIFDKITQPNLAVCLKEVKPAELEALLNYMYLGRAEVKHANIAELMKAAEYLMIKGLFTSDVKEEKGDRSDADSTNGSSDSVEDKTYKPSTSGSRINDDSHIPSLRKRKHESPGRDAQSNKKQREGSSDESVKDTKLNKNSGIALPRIKMDIKSPVQSIKKKNRDGAGPSGQKGILMNYLESGKASQMPSSSADKTLDDDSYIPDESADQWEDIENSVSADRDKDEDLKNAAIRKDDFQCPHCPRKMKNIGNFRQHVRAHQRKFSIRCDFCGKKFQTKSKLDKHLRTHKNMVQIEQNIFNTIKEEHVPENDIGSVEFHEDEVVDQNSTYPENEGETSSPYSLVNYMWNMELDENHSPSSSKNLQDVSTSFQCPYSPDRKYKYKYDFKSHLVLKHNLNELEVNSAIESNTIVEPKPSTSSVKKSPKKKKKRRSSLNMKRQSSPSKKQKVTLCRCSNCAKYIHAKNFSRHVKNVCPNGFNTLTGSQETIENIQTILAHCKCSLCHQYMNSRNFHQHRKTSCPNAINIFADGESSAVALPFVETVMGEDSSDEPILFSDGMIKEEETESLDNENVYSPDNPKISNENQIDNVDSSEGNKSNSSLSIKKEVVEGGILSSLLSNNKIRQKDCNLNENSSESNNSDIINDPLDVKLSTFETTNADTEADKIKSEPLEEKLAAFDATNADDEPTAADNTIYDGSLEEKLSAFDEANADNTKSNPVDENLSPEQPIASTD